MKCFHPLEAVPKLPISHVTSRARRHPRASGTSLPDPEKNRSLAALDDEIRAQAEQLIQVLSAQKASGSHHEEPGFLEKWIAMYLAELLHQEAGEKDAKRRAIREEIARVTPALWEQQLARDALGVRMSIDYWDRQVDQADEATTRVIQAVIDHPERADSLVAGKESFFMRWLSKTEELLIRYLFAVKGAHQAAKKNAAGRMEQVVVAFARRDEEADKLKRIAESLLPDLGGVTPVNVKTCERIINSAVVRIIQARVVIATARSCIGTTEHLRSSQRRRVRAKRSRKSQGGRKKRHGRSA